MKTKIITLLILLVTFNSFSQGFKGKKDKVKALKIAYITEELNLTRKQSVLPPP